MEKAMSRLLESSYEDNMYAQIRQFIKNFVKSEAPLKKRWEEIMDGDVDRHDDYGDLEMIYRVFRDGYRKNTAENSDKPGIRRRVETGEWEFIIPICVSKDALGKMGYLGKETDRGWVGDSYDVRKELEGRLEAAVKKEWPTVKDLEVTDFNYYFRDKPVMVVRFRKHDNSVQGPTASIKKAMANYEKRFGTKIGEQSVDYVTNWDYQRDEEGHKINDERLPTTRQMKIGIYKKAGKDLYHSSKGLTAQIQTFGWFLDIEQSHDYGPSYKYYNIYIVENGVEVEVSLNTDKLKTMTSNDVNKYVIEQINYAFDNAYGIKEKSRDYYD